MPQEKAISIAYLNHYYGIGKLKKQILFDINLEIEPGEITILTGPSGSGKTTLLSLIGGLRSVQQGSLKIFDSELYGANAHLLERVRNRIGFIFQSHNLLNSLTAQQNVQMAIVLEPRITMKEVRHQSLKMLEIVGLGDWINAYPHQLSGGQKQRVAIARALVRQPKLILADEPTASLDKKNGRGVVELMQELAKQQNCTILMVTHDRRILDIADRLIGLEDGCLSTDPYQSF
jgi:putative ABC transport system ATP-binding protein